MSRKQMRDKPAEQTPAPVAEDDVEGHNIGAVNPILARELSRAREQDVARSASRNSVIGEIRRAVRRKP